MTSETPPNRTVRSSIYKEKAAAIQRSILFTVLLPLAFVLGIGVGYILWGLPNKPVTEVSLAAQPDTQNQPAKRYDIPVDDDPFVGPADAPVTIIEFSDYECPYCRKWEVEVWPMLQNEFKDKIRLVYRDLPLIGIHDNAAPAAEAADCAGEQGQYWAFHDRLFMGGQTLDQATYVKYATDLRMDLGKFNECTSSRRYKDEVQADYDYATGLGISSTPTFFVNGLALVGAQPYSVFKQVIEKELAQ